MSGNLLFDGATIGTCDLQDSAGSSVRGTVENPDVELLYKAWRTGAVVKISTGAQAFSFLLDALDHQGSVIHIEGRAV